MPMQTAPPQGTVYWAAEGQGAYVQRPGSEAQRLQAAEVDLSAPGLVVVGSASHLTAETQARQRAWLGCASTGYGLLPRLAMLPAARSSCLCPLLRFLPIVWLGGAE